MEDLEIRGEKREFYVPNVHFQVKTGLCTLSGESYLEQTDLFYAKLQDWIKLYIEKVRGPITFEFRMQYFNTTSTRHIFDLLIQLQRYKEQGGKVKIKWFYADWDEEMLRDGEDFQIQTNLSDFEFIKLPSED